MSNKKLLSLIILLITAMLALTACGGDDNKVNQGTPFSETISGDGIRIWYECQNQIETSDSDEDVALSLSGDDELPTASATAPEFGRETRVVWIKVFQNGKLSTYTCAKNVYLGHFAKMTDEEIVEELKSDKEKYLVGQENADYQLYLYTDSKGQEIKFEGIPCLIRQITKEENDEGEVEETDTNMYYMTLISSDQVPTFQIYDVYYGGYALYNYDQTMFSQACVVTRCDDGAWFNIDTDMELEGAQIDVDSAADVMEELNKPIREKMEKEAKAKEKAKKEAEEAEEAESSFIF